ncbi:MCE family protein [Nocardioides alcanivorans]|uniref:MCE family protein n=1 Tax=Nocardioides alcanivorans TaxID=2897352 RepID=UPI001F1A7F57|nr:MlaD family protein [Nocardioides alcanivorans]
MARMHTMIGAALALALGVSGCSALNAENIPSRSGIEDGYELTVLFPDALNLANGATVKIDGAKVGKVKDVSTENFQAKVELVIDGRTQLPEGTVFRLRPTTALGELFVEVLRGEGAEAIEPGAVIPIADTRGAPTVEDGLAAASLLINGGSLSQIKTIVSEVNDSLNGRTDTVRSLLHGANDLLTSLNDGREDLDHLLRALARTSRLLNEREDEINEAIEIAAPAARVLARNTPQVTALLTQIESMSETVDGLVTATRSDLTRTLRELEPVVAAIVGSKAKAKTSLLEIQKLAPALDNAVPTDYLNLMLVLSLSAETLFGTGDDPGASR